MGRIRSPVQPSSGIYYNMKKKYIKTFAESQISNPELFQVISFIAHLAVSNYRTLVDSMNGLYMTLENFLIRQSSVWLKN